MILVLASASPARLATLRAAGIEPRVQVSGVDEDAVLAEGNRRFGELDPGDSVLLLAQAKAQAVAESLDPLPEDDTLVLGCDSLLELDGQAYGKPRDAEDAKARWRLMRGRSGQLHTGHWLVDVRPLAGTGTSSGKGTGATFGATCTTIVHFADLSDEEIDAYVATEEPLAVAGAFTVDGLGGSFVQGIDGDHHNVVGLSLPLLRELLGQVGVSIPDLWRGGPRAEPMEMELRTERLLLRRFRPEDAATFARYRSAPEVARHQSWDTPFTEDQARELIESLAVAHPDTPGEWFQYAVTDATTGAHLGDVAAFTDADDPRLAKVGVTFAPEAQGKGYATEALTALLDDLLLRRGKHRVSADCDVRNTASAALLERVGMRREALHRSSSFWKGEWTDEYVFAVLADEWEQVRRTDG